MPVTRRALGQHGDHRLLSTAHRCQIATTHHIGDTECQFIHGRGEVIGDESIGPAQHQIPAMGLVRRQTEPPGR